MRKSKVYIVSRCVDSRWPEIEVVKVFKGARRESTIARYMTGQKILNPGYMYWVDTHEVE